jgi:hypothetical protein
VDRLCGFDEIVCLDAFEHFEHHADARAREQKELLSVWDLPEVAEEQVWLKTCRSSKQRCWDVRRVDKVGR